MTDNVTCEIVAIGTEILLGEITDTNSVYIAQQLRDMGINVYYMTTVGDNEGRIASAIELAMGRADVVLTCGGLGPTVDDMTRQAVAKATGRELVFEPTLFDQIAARFASFRVKMSENNRRQAYLPAGATVIENPVGTAPSFAVEHAGKLVISLPGVPRELKYLFSEKVVPYLLQRYQLGVIRARVLRVAGVGESALDEMLGNDLLNEGNPSIGLAAHHGIVDVRLTVKASDFTTAEAMLDTMESRVRARIGTFVFGIGKSRLEDVVAQLLLTQAKKIVVVEAGIEALSRIAKPLKDTGMIELVRFASPEALSDAIGAAGDIRELSQAAVAHYRTWNGAQGCVAIISKPDVSEQSDASYASAVACALADSDISSRGYGFGAQADVAWEWLSRWGLSMVWRMLKEQA